jgi:excisionase family DNA binding protein
MREPTPAATDPGELLSTTEMAKRLGVNRQTLQRWSKAGRVPRVRLGARTFRYSPPAVLEALAAEKAAAEGGPAR